MGVSRHVIRQHGNCFTPFLTSFDAAQAGSRSVWTDVYISGLCSLLNHGLPCNKCYAGFPSVCSGILRRNFGSLPKVPGLTGFFAGHGGGMAPVDVQKVSRQFELFRWKKTARGTIAAVDCFPEGLEDLLQRLAWSMPERDADAGQASLYRRERRHLRRSQCCPS